MSVVGKNILEQEDDLKTLSNDQLLQEIEAPSGLFAPFLPPSEMQRRNEMRDRYEASQEQPSNTIVEQIVAESMGGIAPIGQQGYPPASPMDMLSQPMSSPIPTDLTSQVPVVAAAGAFPDGAMAIEDSGLGGMGGFTEPPMEPQMEQFPQMVAGGGVVGMQAGSQVPTNYKDFIVGQSIIKNRGEDLSMYTLDEIEEIGRTGDNPLPWYTRASGSEAPYWENRYKNLELGEGRTFAPPVPEEEEEEVPYWKRDDYEPPLDYLDVLQGESLTPAIGFEQATGRDIDAPTRWEDASARFNKLVGDDERYPYRHLDPEFKKKLPLGERGMLTLRESFKEIGDLARTLGPAAGEAVVDAATVGITGDPSDPESQRQAAAEERARQLNAFKEGIDGIPGEMMMSVPFSMRRLMSEGLSDEQNRLMLEGMIPDVPESYDPFDPTNERFRRLSDLTVNPEADRDRLMMQTMFPEAMAEAGIPYEGGEGWLRSALSAGQEGLGFFRDKMMGPVVEKGMEFLSPETFLPDPTKSVREAALETEADGARTGGAGGTQFMPAGQTPQIPVTNVGGLNIGALTADYKKRAEEISVSAEEDEATAMQEIASLITKTQDDARGEAFDAWMMNVGAGVASGDMAGGLEKGAVAIGDIKKEARDAVRSLDATRLSRYFEGSKEEMARLVSMASIDANFANALVTLMVEQGRAGRADKILIGSVFAALLDDDMGTYDDMAVADIYRMATRAVTGGNSDIPIPTYNTIEGALE